VTRARDTANTQENIGGSVAPFVAGKNKIINGNMTISQRGTTFTTSSNYTLDRWFWSNFGTATNSSTVSQLTSSPPTNFSSYCEVAAGSTTATNFFISYSMETADVIPLQGNSVTLSFYYKLPTNFTGAWNIVGVYSTNTNQNLQFGASGATNIGSVTTLTNTSSWTRASITFTVPSNATSLGLNLYSTNNVVAAAKFDFTGVQLEAGSVATPFTTATGTVQGELAACQRYYWRRTGQYGSFAQGQPSATTTAYMTVNFPVPMRVVPTAFDVTGTVLVIWGAGSYSTISAYGFSNSDTLGGSLVVTTSGLTLNQPVYLAPSNAGSIGYSAEL
jgi:hypothetical protein